MTNLNQFESVFKSADKAVYTYDRPTFDRVLVVTDLNEADAANITNRVRKFLNTIDAAGYAMGYTFRRCFRQRSGVVGKH